MATYNQPKNRFVASFIGMPPMNFFEGAIRVVEARLVFEEGLLSAKTGPPPGDGGGEPTVGELTLPGNGFRLTVPDRWRTALSNRVGQHVVLGIRPEHFHLNAVGSDADCTPIEMKLNVIEPLGNEMDVYLRTNLTDPVVGRVEATAELAGLRGEERATLFVDLRKIHFFEPGETGMNLSLSPGFSSEPAHALA